MKAIDILPCSREKRHLEIPRIPLFQYTPTLSEELEKGILDGEEALTLYRTMLIQRNFEYMVRDLDNKRFVPHEGYEFRGTTHLSVGQEATAMGAMSVLTRADYITSNHRGHGHCIGKGLFALYGMSKADLEAFTSSAEQLQFPMDQYGDLLDAAVEYHLYRTMAELLGKEAGYCRGRGGGMHIADFSVGNLGANAIVGGSLGIATGAAFTVQYMDEERVVLCCIGDGAMNNGIAHESMNFSVMEQFEKKLPVIYYVENNQYGYTGQQKGEVTGVEYLSQRGAGYNARAMHAETICGMNILSVRDAVRRAREICLEGDGPVLLEANTYRHWGHNFKDKGSAYRTDEEKDAWKGHDPVDWFGAQLVANNLLEEQQLQDEWSKTRRTIEHITRLAAQSKDPKIDNIHFGVWADDEKEQTDGSFKTETLLKETRKIPRDSQGRILARHAVVEALTEEMIRDRRVVVWGEDVAEQGGAYSATLGLLDIFGRSRIFNAAISESAIIGTAIGAAMSGLRPVVEIMYIDFILQAMDQVGNQAAKARFMFGGQFNVPLTIRATIGGGKGYAGQHSQSLEAIVTHFPGLKVVAPSNAYDMKGLLKSAIRDLNPVFFIEHQMVYLEKGVVPDDEDYTVPLGKARTVREGRHITVIAYSNMVSRVVQAADILEKEDGVQVEIIDPRTLVPLDTQAIADSVNKTGRAAIVVQASYTGSYASHISHEIARNCLRNLSAPVRIISGYDITPPMAHALEVENMPNPERIVRSIRETLSEG